MYYVKGHVNLTTDEVTDSEKIAKWDNFIANDKSLYFKVENMDHSITSLYVKYLLKQKINVNKLCVSNNVKYNIDLWFIDETDAGFCGDSYITEVCGEKDYKTLSLSVNPPSAVDFIVTKKKAEMKKWLEAGFETVVEETRQPEPSKSAEKSTKTKKTSPGKLRKFINNIKNIEPSITHLPTLLALLDTDMKTFFGWEEDGLDDSLDYLLEAVLEHVTVLLKNNADEFRLEVEKNGMSMNSLMDVVRNEWLQLMEVPGGTAYEINVRAAEFLGECSKVTGEALDMQIDRIKSDDWHIRMWGAQAIRAMEPPNADELLACLQSDAFEDDNGNFLIREAAGFSSEG